MSANPYPAKARPVVLTFPMGGLVDLVARELLLSREEALTVLESPELGPRIDVVVAALSRES